MEQFDALVHRPLERLAAADETHAAGAVLASIAVAVSGIKTPVPERHALEENAEASRRAVRAFLSETADGSLTAVAGASSVSGGKLPVAGSAGTVCGISISSSSIKALETAASLF